MLGLYDQQGLLRFSGRDLADCLAYAEFFALAEGSFSLEPLVHESEARAGSGDPGSRRSARSALLRQVAAVESITADLAVVHGPVQ